MTNFQNQPKGENLMLGKASEKSWNHSVWLTPLGQADAFPYYFCWDLTILVEGHASS